MTSVYNCLPSDFFEKDHTFFLFLDYRSYFSRGGLVFRLLSFRLILYLVSILLNQILFLDCSCSCLRVWVIINIFTSKFIDILWQNKDKLSVFNLVFTVFYNGFYTYLSLRIRDNHLHIYEYWSDLSYNLFILYT